MSLEKCSCCDKKMITRIYEKPYCKECLKDYVLISKELKKDDMLDKLLKDIKDSGVTDNTYFFNCLLYNWKPSVKGFENFCIQFKTGLRNAAK